MNTIPSLPSRPTLIAAALFAASMLVACDRSHDNQTAGQKLDSAVEAVQEKSAELSADAQAAGKDALRAAGDATATVADKAKDGAITAAVNAKLVADASLSALKIDVDTVSGHVTLSGIAPDAGARDRASTLALQVDGVVAVDNRLAVQRKG